MYLLKKQINPQHILINRNMFVINKKYFKINKEVTKLVMIQHHYK